MNRIDTTIENWFPGTDCTTYLMGQQVPGFARKDLIIWSYRHFRDGPTFALRTGD
ncbi:hypothetical protein [Citrobacter braakii]|uniref:hypothetical protein n=1 Tax=Citrobacter braakii TaxID=57706 RepID=UPI004039606D